MAEAINMPQLGLTMEYGTVMEWLVEEGDSVVVDQEICEVETDKATVAVTSHHSGVVGRIIVAVGEEVPVGAPLCVLLQPQESLPAEWQPGSQRNDLQEAKPQAPTAVSPPNGPHLAPPLLDGGPLQASWKARVLARENDLSLPEITGSGPGGRIVASDVLQRLKRLETAAAEPQTAVPTVPVSPVAARLAKALDIDLKWVKGSGGNGRIMQQDVLETAAFLIREGRQPAEAPSPPRTIPLKGVRKIVSERMGTSARQTARVTLNREVDAGPLIKLRSLLKERDVPVSYNDLLVKMVATALRDVPEANARLGEGQIELLQEVNVGLAVETERGLLVPVVRHADRLDLPQIAAETERLIAAARAGRSHPDDLAGGTFTVTNLGMFGVDDFTPVINLPECCILGVGRIRRRPVVVDAQDTIAVRPCMTLSLVFDHRVLDGAPAARLLQRIAELVEEPLLLLTQL